MRSSKLHVRFFSMAHVVLFGRIKAWRREIDSIELLGGEQFLILSSKLRLIRFFVGSL
jgi:hypothetical protein